MPLRVPLVLLVLFVLHPSARAETAGPAEAWTALRAEAASTLAALAREAQGRKLFRSRDETYEQVLVFDPDHPKARSWLKFKRRDGRWEQTRYTRPKDRGRGSAGRRQEADAEAWRTWWRQQVIRVHRQSVAAGASAVEAEILRFALAFDGEDPAIRALAGEAHHGAGTDACWILLETERALSNRAAFLEAAREAARRVGPARPGRSRAEDRPEHVKWPTVLEGRTVRVVGAVSPAELRRHLEIAESAAAVFSKVFSVAATLPAGEGPSAGPLPLYVAASRGQGNAFLQKEPGIEENGLTILAGLDLAFLPTRPGALVKAGSDTLRWEATAHAVQAHLTRPHLGHEPGASGAWAQEAVTLYLAWLQVRTRLLSTVRGRTENANASANSGPGPDARPPERTGPFGRPRPGESRGPVDVSEATTDWHARAAEAIRHLTPAEFRQVGKKRASESDAVDLLAGYGVAVYVLEAHPDRSAAFFRDVAAQEEADLDQVLTMHLGRDLTTLRPHLLRWLDEMGRHAHPPGATR